MAVSREELWFAPNVRMAELNLDDPTSLITQFEQRVRGYFLEPAAFLRKMPVVDSGLFSCALICAATIEFVSRIDPELHGCKRHIAGWLSKYIDEFSEKVSDRPAAEFFEERFRNGIAHNGYVASLGRLGDIDGIIAIDKDVVTINPFQLVDKIYDWLSKFVEDLKIGTKDIRTFQYKLKELFEDEVRRARQEKNLPNLTSGADSENAAAHRVRNH